MPIIELNNNVIKPDEWPWGEADWYEPPTDKWDDFSIGYLSDQWFGHVGISLRKGPQVGDDKLLVAPSDNSSGTSWTGAVTICEGLGDGWLIPNHAQLGSLCSNKTSIGGFNTAGVYSVYWSTGDYLGMSKYCIRFSDCSTGLREYGNSLRLRCIRIY